MKLKSTVAFITKNDEELGDLANDPNLELIKPDQVAPWTDYYSNILSAMMMGGKEH